MHYCQNSIHLVNLHKVCTTLYTEPGFKGYKNNSLACFPLIKSVINVTGSRTRTALSGCTSEAINEVFTQ